LNFIVYFHSRVDQLWYDSTQSLGFQQEGS